MSVLVPHTSFPTRNVPHTVILVLSAFVVLLSPSCSFSCHFILVAAAFNLLTDFLHSIARARAAGQLLNNAHDRHWNSDLWASEYFGGSRNSKTTLNALNDGVDEDL